MTIAKDTSLLFPKVAQIGNQEEFDFITKKKKEFDLIFLLLACLLYIAIGKKRKRKKSANYMPNKKQKILGT